MKPTTEYIEENLKYIKNLVISDGDRKEDGELLWEFYVDVISEMMKGYAEEQLTDVQRMLQGNDIDGVNSYIKKLKEELI